MRTKNYSTPLKCEPHPSPEVNELNSYMFFKYTLLFFVLIHLELSSLSHTSNSKALISFPPTSKKKYMIPL